MNTNITLTLRENVDLESLLCDVLDAVDKANQLNEGVLRLDCSIFLFDDMEDSLRSILQKLG